MLSDPEEEIYDQCEEGLKEGGMGGGGGGGFDIFEAMFGSNPFGPGGGRGYRGQRKAGVVHGLKVSLEDLYRRDRLMAKNVLCPKCDGKGQERRVGSLRHLQGSGVRVVVSRSPRVVQQMQTVCNECRGSGAGHQREGQVQARATQKVVQEKKSWRCTSRRAW